MKNLSAIFGLVALLLSGCQQPTEVRLTPADNLTNLEVTAVVLPDTTVTTVPVDSSGVLPSERKIYGGIFMINKVTLDFGSGVSSFAYSQGALTNVDSAIRIGDHDYFRGLFLGIVLLNGFPMERHLRLVPVWSSLVDFGWEYGSTLSSTWAPNQLYTWTASPITMGILNLSIRTPEDLTVQAPLGGAVILRDQDLALRWKGQGTISIIVSSYDRLTNKSKPLLQLKPRLNSGYAVFPAKLLSTLEPRREYVFTFILSNRKEMTVVQQYTGKILVQAASIYNTHVSLR